MSTSIFSRENKQNVSICFFTTYVNNLLLSYQTSPRQNRKPTIIKQNNSSTTRKFHRKAPSNAKSTSEFRISQKPSHEPFISRCIQELCTCASFRYSFTFPEDVRRNTIIPRCIVATVGPRMAFEFSPCMHHSSC